MQSRARRAMGAAQRGFTLVELIAVVVIVGILATVATYGVSRYIATAKTAEVSNMISGIKAAEEARRDETFAYLDVSTSDTFYPENAPSQALYSWGNDSHADHSRWLVLGIDPQHPVRYGYRVRAGSASDAIISPGFGPTLTNDGRPWYVVSVRGDQDGDGEYAHWVAWSGSNLVWNENEEE